MYTSKKIDPDTGLYYFNARWYDASLGKFITEDPIKDGVNWYVYCSNNPLNRTDPTGLREIEISRRDDEAKDRAERKIEAKVEALKEL
ncbi:MAG: RHS repeat-associated core domain-containing protein, partial [bacterium]|nr:RHS repeat-associated core domain-containing protein [bacterium]